MIEVGTVLPEQVFYINRAMLKSYADASGDQNPIHQNEEFAVSVGLPNVIAHGMLTMGVAVQLVVDWVGDAGRVSDYQVRFTKPVVVDPVEGAVLVISAKVAELDEALGEVRLDLTVQFGEATVLGKAQAWVQF